MLFSEYYPEYFTATTLNWTHLLQDDKRKNLITASLQYLVNDKRIKVVGFAIMSNHIHVIWQVMQEHKPSDVQLSFMKYTAQMLIKELRNEDRKTLESLRVNAQDRKFQVW